MNDSLLLLASSDLAGLAGAGAIILFFLLLIVGLGYLGHQAYLHQVQELRDFARTLLDGAVVAPTTYGSRLTQCNVTGRVDGHDLRVTFVRRGSGKHAYTAIAYEVQVQHPAASFEVAETAGLEALGRWLGLTKVDELNQQDLVLRQGGARAGRLLQASDMQASLRRVLNLSGVGRVALQGTTLRIEQRDGVHARSMQPAIRALVELARLCGRVAVPPLKVVVSPREATPVVATRFAWTGGGETARCPYCRDELDAAASDAAACERCGTVHHRECLDEAGGCTVFGCGARATEADRVRA